MKNENTTQNKMKKGKKNRKKALIVTIAILIAFIAIVAGIYLVAANYFKTHYYSGSKINGIDCTGKTVDDVRKIINDELKEYSISVTGRSDKSLTITGADIDLEYVDDNTLQKLLDDQNPYLWFKAFSSEKEYTMGANTTFSQDKLKALMEASSFFAEDQVTVPADAYMQENDTGYEIVPEVMGDQLDEEKVLSILTDAIDNGGESVNLEEESYDCYLKPTIYSTDEAMNNKVNTLNTLLSVNITIPFGDRQEVIDPAQVKAWIIQGDDGSVTLDETAIGEYVRSLAYKYDTFGLSRSFKTHAGKTITIEAGGDYGWAMNKTTTTENLIAAIRAGGEQQFEPTYLYSAMSRNADDIGGTYVEVSLSEQRMWCYKDGQVIVDTPVVTGLPTEDRMTHTGIYAIDAKKSPAVLKGQGYATDVTYWMPFNGNEGIHDADTWRSEYGGTIYQTNGSHGCVNTPKANAQTIYNTVQIGTAVVVY